MKTVTQVTPKVRASFGVGFILFIPIVATSQFAQQWSGNGHYYEVVNVSTSWKDAKALAEGMDFMGFQGHLATITSADENTFVTTQLGTTAGAWLGGYQPTSGSEPAGDWQWITGEPWAYTQWDVGEPNNTYGGGWGTSNDSTEEVLHYHHSGTHWNDLPDYSGVITPRFLVEWDVPQPDEDGDGVPDALDACPGTPEGTTVNAAGCPAGECFAPPSGMTGWWPGDGNTGDIVGCRNAVLHDNATFGAALVGDGFVLDGVGAFVDVPDFYGGLNVGTGDFTVDLWVNFNTTAGEQVLVEKWIQRFGDASVGWTFTKLDGNVLLLAMADGTGPEIGVATDVLSIATGTWNHFAATRQGGHITLYINGEPVATGTSPLNVDSTSSLKFGHRGNSSDTPGSEDGRGFFMNGQIDEVELFVGRALSNAEILAIAEAGGAGKCKDADGEYGFDGFLPPIGGADATGGTPTDSIRTFKLGSTVPFKFIISCGGSPVTTGIHTLSLQKIASGADIGDPVTPLPTDVATAGDQFRFTDRQWHYNLNTKPLTQGLWRATAKLADGSKHVVYISLKK